MPRIVFRLLARLWRTGPPPGGGLLFALAHFLNPVRRRWSGGAVLGARVAGRADDLHQRGRAQGFWI
jgi:hypothetical protein